jgi:hypothetical protein
VAVFHVKVPPPPEPSTPAPLRSRPSIPVAPPVVERPGEEELMGGRSTGRVWRHLALHLAISIAVAATVALLR